MKKHLKVMRKAKAVTNGLPGVVIDGNNGSNKARAAHLLAQLERFREQYGGGVVFSHVEEYTIPAPTGPFRWVWASPASAELRAGEG